MDALYVYANYAACILTNETGLQRPSKVLEYGYYIAEYFLT